MMSVSLLDQQRLCGLFELDNDFGNGDGNDK
jgi:hypothetical protein